MASTRTNNHGADILPKSMLMNYVSSGELDLNMTRRVRTPATVKTTKTIRHWYPGRIRILESITVIAMRIQDYKNGDCELDEVRVLFKKQFSNPTQQEIRFFNNDIRLLDLTSSVNEYSGSFISGIISRYGYSMTDLYHWTKCIKAKTMLEALNAMDHQGIVRWPEFLVYFTYKRSCESRYAAYKLARHFQSIYADFDKYPHGHGQITLFIRMLRSVDRTLVDFIPPLSMILINHTHRGQLTPSLYNQLLWLLAKMGTNWSERECMILSEAAKILVTDMKKNGIELDTKGYLALGFIFRTISPERAKEFAQVVERHEYVYSQEEQAALDKGPVDESSYVRYKEAKDVYTHGLFLLKLSLASNLYEALSIFDSVPKSKQNSLVWAQLLDRLNELSLLTPPLTEVFWQKIRNEVRSLSPYLLMNVLEGYKPMEGIETHKNPLEVITEAVDQGCRINRSVTTKYIQRLTETKQLHRARVLVSNCSEVGPETYSTLIIGEANNQEWDNVWITYKSMLKAGHEPTLSVLKSLCSTARHMHVMWDGMYAVQRAVVEVKRWVRGAHLDNSDIDDQLKLYPDNTLFHFFIQMLGFAGYDQELLEVLPWMQRIGLVPDNWCLCALIIFSPNGKYLHRHGKVSKLENWPSDSDIESYRFHLSRLR